MKKKNQKALLLIAVAAVIYLAILMITLRNVRHNSADTVALTDGWILITADAAYTDLTYDAAIRQAGEPAVGDTVTFVKRLEDMGSAAFPTVFLRTDKSAVEVFLDDELIYAGQMERVPDQAFVGRRVRFITLPYDYAGKELRLVCYISRTGVSRGGDAPRYGDYMDCQEYYIQRLMPAIAAGVGLLIFGFVFLFISLFFVNSATGQGSEIVSSITCIDMGVWLLGFFDVTRIYVSDAYTTAIEYVALYLMLPLLYLWLGHMYPRMRVLRIAGYTIMGIIALLAVLHVTGTVRIDDWIAFYLLVSAATFVYCLVFLIRKHRRIDGEIDISVQETGVILVTASMLLYLVIYSLQSFAVLPESMMTMYIPVIGITGFVVSQIIYYFIHVSEAYARRKEFSALSHLAYVDVLTGLPNRKAAWNIFERLDTSATDYAILSLDLNGLKFVNDRYGHPEGDRVLQMAAQVLNDCFADIGFRARLSGDEYMVVIRRAVREEVDERIAKMHARFAALSTEQVTYSISCGAAFASELPAPKAEEVYRLADERMYEEKQRYYESLH